MNRDEREGKLRRSEPDCVILVVGAAEARPGSTGSTGKEH